MSVQSFSVTPLRRPVVRASERLNDEILESVMGLQECLDPPPQPGIAVAFSIVDNTAARVFMMAYSFKENDLHSLRFRR